MKFLAVFAFAAFVAVANADVSHVLGQAQHHYQQYNNAHYQPGSEAQAQIVKSTLDNPGSGSYSFGYETQNGIKAEEAGSLKKAVARDQEDAVVAQGNFAYTAPDGTPVAVQYVADENGFQPQGAHLPVPPAIPEAILRSLEYNAAHPEQN